MLISYDFGRLISGSFFGIVFFSTKVSLAPLLFSSYIDVRCVVQCLAGDTHALDNFGIDSTFFGLC